MPPLPRRQCATDRDHSWYDAAYVYSMSRYFVQTKETTSLEHRKPIRVWRSPIRPHAVRCSCSLRSSCNGSTDNGRLMYVADGTDRKVFSMRLSTRIYNTGRSVLSCQTNADDSTIHAWQRFMSAVAKPLLSLHRCYLMLSVRWIISLICFQHNKLQK